MTRAGRNKKINRKSVFAINGKNPTGKNRNSQNPTASVKIRTKSLFYTKIIIYVHSLQVKNSKCPNFGDV